MKQSKTGWRKRDLESLYLGFGFEITAGGKHDKVRHPEFPQLFTSLPRHNKLAQYNVTNAIRPVEKLKSLKDE